MRREGGATTTLFTSAMRPQIHAFSFAQPHTQGTSLLDAAWDNDIQLEGACEAHHPPVPCLLLALWCSDPLFLTGGDSLLLDVPRVYPGGHV